MAVFFLLYVIVEVAAVIAVANAVGVLWMLVLLLAGAVVGSWLAKREGARAMQAVMRTARAGGTPHREVTDGMLIAFGGMLILIPGFVSDLFGLLFLLPPTRGLMRRAVLRRSARRPAAFSTTYGRGPVVEGEVIDGEWAARRDSAGQAATGQNSTGQNSTGQPAENSREAQPKVIDPGT